MKYSDATGSLCFYSKDEATNFSADIVYNNAFKFFKYNTKLLKINEPDRNNGILKNVAIVVPLKYLSNFWRSLEIPLINCKEELKLKWTNHSVLSANNNDNDDANSNYIIFTTKETKLVVPVLLYQQKTIKN